MTFDEVLKQVRELLQSKSRVAYRALKRRFELDDEYLEDLKAELIDAEHVARDEDGKVLVWTGAATKGEPAIFPASSDARPQRLDARPSSGERRQLTVMFIDLVGSTTLSQQLDPEEYHARVHAYQTACSQIIARYEGHVAQYLGDGVLVYFGYPAAHEDDAGRAVRSGLEIVAVVSQLQFTPPLEIRIGIHTGPVVVAEIGTGVHTEQLALGETPNLAARVQGLAAPNAVVISAATERLVRGLFECRDLGRQEVKGITTPLALAQVMRESAARSRFEAATHAGLTPLVGREHEIAMLLERWQLAQNGEGQVVLLSGEPGIGKSRILSALWERLEGQGAQALRLQSSPYYLNSALYPIIDNFERTLKFGRDESAESKLDKLEALLVTHYGRPQQDVRFIAALLSLPCEERYGTIAMAPQKHRNETLRALVDLVEAAAHQQPTVMLFEDAHWADPTSLEVLDLLIDRVRNVPLLIVVTHRPEFPARWSRHSQVTALSLSKLTRAQSNAIVATLTSGKALPAELLGQILAKTDGVPLFVEELTKTVLESITSSGSIASIASVIPATLHDALMARLDRLGPAKEVAQMGATLGREFSYELLQAVSPKKETNLQQALAQLIEAEVLYLRGAPPQTRYLFKHALIQDVAYQSLLKRTRQQYHSKIAQVMEEQLAETKETPLELLAHHYTEAGLLEHAIPYWQQAGQRAIERSAHAEAISHLTKGLDLLKALPDTPEHLQKELLLQTALGPALIATKGQAAPDVAKVYTRAYELCQQLGDTPQLFPVILGLRRFYFVQAELQTARKLGEQLLSLAQNAQDSSLLLEAHGALGLPLFCLGELTAARAHFEQGIALYDPQQHGSHVFLYGQDPGVLCRVYAAFALWPLGYPDQALKRINEALTLAREISHPYSLAFALFFAAWVHQERREEYAVQQRVEEMMRLCHEHGFPFWLAEGMILQGWVLIEQGKYEEGVEHVRQGVAAHRDTGVKLARPYFLAVLAEAYRKVGQGEEALAVLTEALAMVKHKGERIWEAELDRLKGELTLQRGARDWGLGVGFPSSQAPSHKPQVSKEMEEEAEECFLKAIEIARQQQAKSLELRAAMSLSRLWWQQGKKAEARQMLADLYNWFTEGFDTKDLQEAKALLHKLV